MHVPDIHAIWNPHYLYVHDLKILFTHDQGQNLNDDFSKALLSTTGYLSFFNQKVGLRNIQRFVGEYVPFDITLISKIIIKSL